MSSQSARMLSALIICVFAVSQLIATASRKQAILPDQIGLGLSLYRKLTADLPAYGEIGFLPTSGDATFDAANHFVAQHALAPRLVLDPFDNVRFVVTGVDPEPDIESDSRLRDFELVAIRDRGIRIFRRIDQ